MLAGLLSVATLVLAGFYAFNVSLWGGVLFALAFFVATGAGAVLRRTIRGTLKAPVPMYAITAAVLGLAFWLASRAGVSISLATPSQMIQGEWWAVIAGTLAGAL